MNTKITLDEWLQHSVINQNNKPENAFTVAEVLEKNSVNRRTLVARLDKLIQDGKLKKGTCIVNGRIQNYYIPTELENESKRTNGHTTSEIYSGFGKKVKGGAGRVEKKKR